MRTIIVYGDSNTYGYDPADFFGGPYPLDRIWTSIVQENLEGRWKVINRGENGRRIPDPAGGYRYAETLLDGLTEEDIFAVMLGLNDLLLTTNPDANLPISKMDSFLSWLQSRSAHPIVLLIAPPPVEGADSSDLLFQRFYQESMKMNEGFERLAVKHNVLFADASQWPMDYAFDHIHLSERGHAIFAEHMSNYLQGI